MADTPPTWIVHRDPPSQDATLLKLDSLYPPSYRLVAKGSRFDIEQLARDLTRFEVYEARENALIAGEA